MEVRRILLRVAGAVPVLATLITLAGCTPKEWPMIGVVQVDGRPVVLAPNCPDQPLGSYVWVTRYVTAGPADKPEVAEKWWIEIPWAGTGSQAAVPTPQRLTLLDPPPPGWKVTVDSLTEFQEGLEYMVSSGHRGKSLTITLADVRALKPGEILIAADYPDRNKVISEKEYVDGTAKHCDD